MISFTLFLPSSGFARFTYRYTFFRNAIFLSLFKLPRITGNLGLFRITWTKEWSYLNLLRLLYPIQDCSLSTFAFTRLNMFLLWQSFLGHSFLFGLSFCPTHSFLFFVFVFFFFCFFIFICIFFSILLNSTQLTSFLLFVFFILVLIRIFSYLTLASLLVLSFRSGSPFLPLSLLRQRHFPLTFQTPPNHRKLGIVPNRLDSRVIISQFAETSWSHPRL
jgi:hypothetical protein